MLLSIIIVTYNANGHIEACLSKLYENYSEDFEVIMLDGGSTDDTVKTASKYIKAPNIIISEKDRGIYDAMNKAIRVATGDFLYFLGADDIWTLPPYEVKAILKEHDTIYYGNVAIKEKPGKIYGTRFWKYSIINRNICHQAIFYPRQVFKDHSYELKYELLADYVLNLKLWSDKKFKFQYIDKVFATYSIHGASSAKIDTNFRKDIVGIIYKNYGLPGLIMKAFNPLVNIFRKRLYEY
ncbi:MAG TPA: glycosyltransferase [Parafilimonas sp.]|nr:glycosyltransferase [Parafilimonas sp.]